MKIEVVRTKSTDFSLMGRLAIDGVFCCYTIERPYDDLDHKPIPEGEYPLRMRDSAHWAPKGYPQVPGIFDVPGRSDIEIHPANRANELRGCIGIGQQAGEDVVLSSRLAFNALLVKLKDMPKDAKILITKEIV